jgi:hypothetical protein
MGSKERPKYARESLKWRSEKWRSERPRFGQWSLMEKALHSSIPCRFATNGFRVSMRVHADHSLPVVSAAGAAAVDTRIISIDVRVMRLRRKLQSRPGAPQTIETVRGLGYAFKAVVEPL